MNVSDTRDLTAMVRGYLMCASWTAYGEDGETLSFTDGPGDVDGPVGDAVDAGLFDLPTIVEAVQDCQGFCEYVEEVGMDRPDHHPGDRANESAARVLAVDMDPEQAGHDFYLTRNHSGAGFWDRGLGVAGDRLTEAAQTFGETDIWITYKGKEYSA